jgi:hypothetical protein
LVCIPHEAAAGAKSIAHLSHPVHGDLGGIELLAKLQQIAFIGTHNKTRRQMDWWKTDAPDEKLRAPKVDAGIPLLKSREAVDKILELVLAALGTLGITHTWTKTKEHDPANNNHTSPADQAAPSIGALLELLRGMPNPASASRVGIYLSVMHGAAGCVRAARTLTPKITKAEEVEVAHEAASWAARWESGNSASYQFERDKFNDDFLKSGTVFSGWRTLLLAATELGFTDASYIDAAEEFEAVHMTIAEERRLALRARLAKTVLPNGPRGRPPSVEFLKYDKKTKSPKQLLLIEGLMTEGCMAMMYGKYKAGKTFISLSMMLHVAAGMPWMGKATRQGSVVYIIGEGVTGFPKRIQAMKEQYGLPDELPFHVIARAVDFTSPAAVQLLMEDIADLMTAEGESLAAIVIDTVARALPGADENSSQEMRLFTHRCDQLRFGLNCSVFVVHHAGKDLSRGARGSTVIPAAIDSEFVIDRKPSFTTFTVENLREGQSGEVITFNMLVAVTGEKESTLIPVLLGAVETSQGIAPPAPPKLAGDQELAFGALEEALRTTGEDRPSGLRICTVEAWRRIYYSKRGGDEPDAKKKGFKRSRTALLGKGLIDVNDPYVWVRTAWSDAGVFTAATAAEMAVLLSAAPPSSGLN